MLTRASNFLYGQSESSRIENNKNEIRLKCSATERRIAELDREIQKENTIAENLIYGGKPNESDAHYRRIAALRRQVRILQNTKSHLIGLETRLQQIETTTMVTNTFNNVSRTLESSSARVSSSQVKTDVMRMQKAELKLQLVTDEIAEAMEYESDDDADNEIDTNEANECAAMKEAAMLKLMPSPSYGMPSPLSSSASLNLPELKPLPKH